MGGNSADDDLNLAVCSALLECPHLNVLGEKTRLALFQEIVDFHACQSIVLEANEKATEKVRDLPYTCNGAFVGMCTIVYEDELPGFTQEHLFDVYRWCREIRIIDTNVQSWILSNTHAGEDVNALTKTEIDAIRALLVGWSGNCGCIRCRNSEQWQEKPSFDEHRDLLDSRPRLVHPHLHTVASR